MGTVDEIRIARRTGFCYGVREAIDKAKEASAAGKTTHTLGQVVHNEGVIADLERLGIQTVDTLDDVDHGAAVVIRAHGVRPEVMERAAERGLEVIDGTCTWVIQEQREIVKLVEEGYTIVLLGTPRHPEVVGLLGLRAGRDRRRRGRGLGHDPAAQEDGADQPEHPAALEVREARRVHGLPQPRAQDHQHGLPGHDPPPGGHARGGPQVDLMVVVGGRSSANTKELTRLCGIAGTPAIQIEGVSDLADASVFDGKRVVGVTGGTSTPIEDLRAVARRVLELAGTPEVAAKADELALAALASAATPAGRTTSLPTFTHPAPPASGAA